MVAAQRGVTQLVADVGNLCGSEAERTEAEGATAKTESCGSGRADRHQVCVCVCGAVADLWLTPCRPNSDRISFITGGQDISFLNEST